MEPDNWMALEVSNLLGFCYQANMAAHRSRHMDGVDKHFVSTCNSRHLQFASAAIRVFWANGNGVAGGAGECPP